MRTFRAFCRPSLSLLGANRHQIVRSLLETLVSFHFTSSGLVLLSCCGVLKGFCSMSDCRKARMTDVKVIPRQSYCLRRQSRLPDCQLELVGAVSKLSFQCFGLDLHIRSLEHCRLWGENTHTVVYTQLRL